MLRKQFFIARKVLRVQPGQVTALSGKLVQATLDVAGIEVVLADPGLKLHRLVLVAQSWHNHRERLPVHMLEQTTHIITEQVCAKRPARSEVAKNPNKIR